MEKWREVYSDEQLKKVQELELKNLQVLDEVCKKIGVKFFAYGGTLIGAIRHKGFVPWDDDLDVAMVRSDYVKFVQHAEQYLPSNYTLQSPYNDPKSPYSYTKLRLNGTKYIEYAHHKLKIAQGIYIDIYPIDNLPDTDEEFFKQYKKFHRLSVLYARRQCPYIEQKEKNFKNACKQAIKFVSSFALKAIPRRLIVSRMDHIATKYNDKVTSRKGNLYYPKPVNVFESLYPLENGVFEGFPILLPGGWDQHLTSRYGNYMEFPPEEKRIGHRPFLLHFGNH